MDKEMISPQEGFDVLAVRNDWRAMRENVGIENAYQRFNQYIKSMNLSKAAMLALIERIKETEYDVDYDFVKMFLFPEKVDPVRLPSRFSVPTALFTHKFSFTVPTGPQGCGCVTLLPHDTSYTSCFSFDGISNAAFPLGFYNVNPVLSSDSRFIGDTFARTRLLAASINVQYMGPQEQEAGIMQGGHFHSQRIGQLGQDVFDDGYFVTRSRPIQGSRLVWTPKDDSDYNFSDCNYRVTDNTPLAGSITSDQIYVGQNLASNANPRLVVNATANNVTQALTTITSTTPNNYKVLKFLPGDVWGIKNLDQEQQYPQQLAVMWTGLVANQNWIRVDVTRHFEAVPYPAKRDIICTKKSKPDDKTLDALKQICRDDRLFGHTAVAAEKLMDAYCSSAVDLVQSKINAVATGSYQGAYGGNQAAVNNLSYGTIATRQPEYI